MLVRSACDLARHNAVVLPCACCSRLSQAALVCAHLCDRRRQLCHPFQQRPGTKVVSRHKRVPAHTAQHRVANNMMDV